MNKLEKDKNKDVEHISVFTKLEEKNKEIQALKDKIVYHQVYLLIPH
jgi:hypothetical protein